VAGADAPQRLLIHGTCLAIGGCGVLILGAPGSGKSDLALRLIDQPGRGTGGKAMTARLVADDQVAIARRDGRLIAAPPPGLAGLMEVRGLGIVRVEWDGEAELGLAVRLADSGSIERLPEHSGSHLLLGIALPEIAIDPDVASAPARVRAGIVELLRRASEIAR
jgi:serine kinase of HPr protein (carbohydrate metabolism regulator)